MDDADDRPAPYEGFDKLYIDGQWRDGSSKPSEDKDPFSGQRLTEVAQADKGDLDRAYAAAARVQPEWAAQLPMARAAVFDRAARIMERRREEIIGWLVRESGSTRLKATLEWQAVLAGVLEAAALPHMVEGRLPPIDIPGKESRVYRKAVGVVGVISPWNFPLQLSNRSVAPALAVGNAVVLKPASDTPVTGGLLLAKLFEEAGLPPGVLNVTPGSGSEIGDAFVTHAIPRVISFTGSTEVGRGIARLAADAPILKKLELELGGNSPLVVLEDADLDLAVTAAIWGKFLHQGQICMIANRLIVADAIFDAFASRFAEQARNLRIGDPDDPNTFIGPIINRSQFDSLNAKIAAARGAGLRELAGGEPDGLVLPPHVYADVPNDDPLAQDEIFGPIAPLIRARDEDDALRLANATDRGLSAAVFTRDVERGSRFARRVQSGMCHVNDQSVNDMPFNPFGGEKNSGLGRFNGRWAVDAFTTDQWITIQQTPRPYPFDAQAAASASASAGG
jgi:aldehyde dehydrogenase (NAD+)